MNSKNCLIWNIIIELLKRKKFLSIYEHESSVITEKIQQQQEQQKKKTRQGGVVTVVIEIEEVGVKALDHHIERLEAKLSFLIRSYDNDDPHTDLSDDEYKKKIATIKQEIDDAMKQRRTSNRLEQQMSVIRYSIF
jgi:hypothetical protein